MPKMENSEKGLTDNVEDYLFHYDSEEHVKRELALSKLLKDGVIFPIPNYIDEEREESTYLLFYNANDLFAWGCAEGISIESDEELKNLIKMHLSNEKYGATKWACMKRGEKPQKPIQNNIKEAGEWDEEMENLDENQYWKNIEE